MLRDLLGILEEGGHNYARLENRIAARARREEQFEGHLKYWFTERVLAGISGKGPKGALVRSGALESKD